MNPSDTVFEFQRPDFRRRREPYASRPAPKTPAADDVAKLNARLAAEAAFSMPDPEPVPADQQTQVIVRRSRLPLAAGDAPLAETPLPEALAAADAAPRVFRIDKPAVSADDTVAEVAAPAPVAAAPQPETDTLRVVRHRRSAPERRPGPVVQLFKAPPEAPRPEADMSRARVADLLGDLQTLEPVFDSIRSAQAFGFADDDVFADEWLRLDREAESIRLDIERELRHSNSNNHNPFLEFRIMP